MRGPGHGGRGGQCRLVSGAALITWKILDTSSEFRCCATSHSLAVISIRRQMSMSTFMAFSWIFVSRSVMGCREDSRGLCERGGGRHPQALAGQRGGEAPGCQAGGPRSPRGVLQPLLGVKGQASGSGSGPGAGGRGRRGDRGGLCLPVSLRAGRHPPRRQGVSVCFVGTMEKDASHR